MTVGNRRVKMLEEYLNVETGEDLIRLGVIPKDSSSHMALITYKRLVALRDSTLESITDEMLGAWIPAAKPIVSRIVDSDEISKRAREGMRVEGTGVFEDGGGRIDFNGMGGTIRKIKKSKDKYGIEWDQPLPRGHDLNGEGRDGYCWTTDSSVISLLFEGYTLEGGVIADKQTGHRVRFSEDFTAKIPKDKWEEVSVEIPAGTVATLYEFDEAEQTVAVKFDDHVPGYEDLHLALLPIESVYNFLQASSLGQEEPADKEDEVRKQSFYEFFPKTIFDSERAERLIMALLMKKDTLIYGPPGSGKTNVIQDMVDIAKLQEILFKVEGCKVQCNPFSLFDEKFAKECPPCASCMIEYDDNYKKTGFFRRPAAKDVKVTVAKYGPAEGIEKCDGTIGLNRMHLAGFKIPKADAALIEAVAQIASQITGKKLEIKVPGTNGDSEFDPEGFHPGALARTNNGILHLSEGDKLREQTMDNLLEALEDNEIQPDQLRFGMPAHNLVLTSANDQTAFTEAINDRMPFLAIRYTDDVLTSRLIATRGYHREFDEAEKTPVGDTHREQPLNLRKILMPLVVESAVHAFYIKFRQEYDGRGKNEVSGSNRSMFDAFDASRAKLLIDQLFFSSSPKIVTGDYAVNGIQYALCSRVSELDPRDDKESKQEICQWVSEKFPEVLDTARNNWWCLTYKNMSIRETQIPGIEANFFHELESYESDLMKVKQTYELVKRACDDPDDERAQMARIDYPFMDYLFKEQIGIEDISEGELLHLTRYLLKSREGVACTVDETEDAENT